MQHLSTIHPVSLFFLLGLCACSGKGDDGNTRTDGVITNPITDDQPDLPTADTVIDGSYIDATYFLVLSRFAYDEENEQFLSYAHPDEGLISMSLTILLVDSDVVNTGVIDSSNSCFVTMEFDGPLSNAAWVEETDAWAGFDLPSGATVRDNCQFYGLPALWEGDVASHVTKWSWSAGAGPLDDDTRATLEQQLPASEWAALQPFVFGGAFASDLFTLTGIAGDDGYANLGIGLAFEIDGNFQIEVGGTGSFEPIDSQFVNAPGGIATGYYEVEVGLFEPASILTNPLP